MYSCKYKKNKNVKIFKTEGIFIDCKIGRKGITVKFKGDRTYESPKNKKQFNCCFYDNNKISLARLVPVSRGLRIGISINDGDMFKLLKELVVDGTKVIIGIDTKKNEIVSLEISSNV